MSLLPALERNEFSLVYQPIVQLPSTRVIAVEALLRHTATDLDRAPIRQIRMAEATGEIVQLGAWVMHRACQDAVRLMEVFGPDLRIDVNVSMTQLEDPAVIEIVQEALAASGLKPQSLELEVTESVLLSQRKFARHSLRNLQNLGCGVALDDFGCGFSNLQHLCHLRVNRLKTDRSILRSSSRRWPILDAVIALAKQLHIPIVAEGIETEVQLRKVLRAQCEEAQGYFFSCPLSIEELLARSPELESRVA